MSVLWAVARPVAGASAGRGAARWVGCRGRPMDAGPAVVVRRPVARPVLLRPASSATSATSLGAIAQAADGLEGRRVEDGAWGCGLGEGLVGGMVGWRDGGAVLKFLQL